MEAFQYSPLLWVSGALSLGVKRQGREDDHSPPSSAKIKNAWHSTNTPSWRGAQLKHRYNFTFTFTSVDVKLCLSLALREENNEMRMFSNEVPRKMFSPKSDGDRTMELQNMKLHKM
jgi:hypothetical protein